MKLTKYEREQLNKTKEYLENEHENDKYKDDEIVVDDDVHDDVQVSKTTRSEKPLYIPPQENMNNAIEEAFSSEMGGEHEIVKELFNTKNIYAKTELSSDEISIVSRLYYLADYIEHPQLAQLLDKLLMLRISKDRKSREEVVKALVGVQPKNNQQFGFMPMGNGGFR